MADAAPFLKLKVPNWIYSSAVDFLSDPDVRIGSEADMCSAKSHVRFTPESGHVQCTHACPLSAKSGHSNRSALAKRRTPGRGALIVNDYAAIVAAFRFLR